MEDFTIIYQDSCLIVVNKHSLIPTESFGGDNANLWDSLFYYLKSSSGFMDDIYLGVCHRLDQAVSGVLVFARNKPCLKKLNSYFKRKLVKKTYWAIVSKSLSERSATLLHYILSDKRSNISTAYKTSTHGAKQAVLHYREIGRINSYPVLFIRTESGRHHQIRVQLAAHGYPILGDRKYGSELQVESGRVYLHARSIHFPHPINGEDVSFQAETPSDTLWSNFKEEHL